MDSVTILSKTMPPCQEKKRDDRPKITFSRPFIAAAMLAAAVLKFKWLLLLGMAAAIHEGGHLLALRTLGSRVREIRFRLSGMELRYRQDCLTYGKEAAAALAGPGINILAAILLIPFAIRTASSTLFLWIGCHAALAAFNLIPAAPLDGGRALRCLLCALWPRSGPRVSEIMDRAVGIGISALGLFILLRFRNPTLFAAGMLIFAGGSGKRLYKGREKR